jgi:exosortase D (VPLPA-CTERM-specific)
MSATVAQDKYIHKASPSIWFSVALISALLIWAFSNELSYMVSQWDSVQEFSYGYLIPVVVLFLLWQKSDVLTRMEFEGSWLGVVVIGLGAALYAVGQLSTINVIAQYAFLVVLYGIVLAFMGLRGFKIISMPLLILVFMIPLPQFFFAQLSSQFQLVSSEIGVAVIRLFGISVFLEGNVIDLGTYKLQVVEACSGLRYLFPLMVFGFILAYFFKASWWKRAVIFLSTIPITILMNSFRIGVIGVTVNYWGEKMAEGFLHDFEGWVIFMTSTAVLAFEIWIFARLSKDKRPLRQVFGLELPASPPKNADIRHRPMPKQFVTALVAVGVFSVASAGMPEREEIIPNRTDFGGFPLALENWIGKSDRLEAIYVDALKFNDYTLINYVDDNKQLINFYVAYYASQRGGQSAHSPRSCLPGGGWKITSLMQQAIPETMVNGFPLTVNRALIEMGDQKQLVYYWFQQRGRVINNEYLVKWYLFLDALTRNRTDGALVRITTQVPASENIEQADSRLIRFAQTVNPLLNDYIPL